MVHVIIIKLWEQGVKDLEAEKMRMTIRFKKKNESCEILPVIRLCECVCNIERL